MDIQLNYQEKGRGKPLILLHGNGESLAYFRHQINWFSKSYRTIALDTRGHGGSPAGTMPISLDQFAEDLCGFMDGHNIEKAHILGFSDGANIALKFALKYPARIDKLVLNGANITTAGVKPSTQRFVEMSYRFVSRFAASFPAAKQKADILKLMVDEPNITPEQLHDIRIPTLVIAGSRDMIKESHTRLIYQSLPDAQLALIQGDHFIARKNPRAFNQRVQAFLDGDRA